MRGRPIGVAILVLAAAVAAVAWLAVRPAPTPPSHGVVVIAAPPPPAAPVPVPPPVRGAVAAPADAFVGRWRSRDDALMVIARSADRYEVNLTIDGTSAAYDGVLKDGRVQIARGIDGEWIQLLAGGGTPCLQLGDSGRFCRS